MFDVDKMFLMIPEFKTITKYSNMKKIWDDFYQDPSNADVVEEIGENYNEALARFIAEQTEDWDEADKDLSEEEYKQFEDEFKQWLSDNGIANYRFSKVAQKRFTKWFKEKLQEGTYEGTVTIKKVRYNNNKSVEGNTRAQRNNMLLDISYAILTSPEVANEINTPGNFDKLKLESRLAEITNDLDLLNKYADTFNVHKPKEIINSLLNADLKTLNKFLEDSKKELSPLTLDTFMYYHNQNMTGGALIGVYANNTTMQAKYQNSTLAIKDKYIFNINGRTVKSLHEIETVEDGIKTKISKNCAQFSAASVDNVKDPVLAKLLQNMNTAKIAGFMLRAGMSIREIGLLFTQPIVRECFEDTGSLDKLDSYIAKYVNLYKNSTKYSEDIKLQQDYKTKNLLGNIILFNKFNIKNIDINSLKESNASLIPLEDIYSKTNIPILDAQLTILKSNIESALLMERIVKIANDLADSVKISRADSPNGAIARSLAMAKNQVQNVRLFHIKSQLEDFTLEGTEDIVNSDYVSSNMNRATLRENFMKSRMPMLQAFYTLGIEFGLQADAKYFTQLNPVIDTIVEELYKNSPRGIVSDEILDKFYFDLVTFGLSKTELFGDDANQSLEEKRAYYLYKFPSEFLKMKADPNNTDIFNLGLIRKLNIDNGVIKFENSSKVDDLLAQMFMRDMDMLLYMDNPNAQKLAIDLFMYSYYLDGFKFGPSSFGRFFSTTFITSFPEVINTLRDMNSNITEKGYWKEFLLQFYTNNFNNPSFKGKLIKEYKTDFPVSPIERNGVITLTIPRKVANNKIFKGECYKYITFDGNIYEIMPNNISNRAVSYQLVPTYKDPGYKKLYNASKTNSELAEVPTYKELFEESRKVSTTPIKETKDLTEMDSDYLEELAVMQGYSNIDKSLEYEEIDINIDSRIEGLQGDFSNMEDMEFIEYNPTEGLAENDINKCPKPSK